MLSLKFSFPGLKILTDIHSSNTFTQPGWGKGERGEEKRGQNDILNFLKVLIWVISGLILAYFYALV